MKVLQNITQKFVIILDFYFDNSLKIKRFLITGLSAYVITIILIKLFQISYFSLESAIIVTQFLKIFIMFFVMKYYVFKNDNPYPHNFKLYIITVISLRILELILMYSASIYEVNIFINVFCVLGLSTVIKFFIFKKIFREDT